MIVHRVVDHPDNLLLRVSDGRTNFRCKISAVGQVPLVKELGGKFCSTNRHQRRMRRKSGLLLRLVTGGQPPTQQAGSTDLGDRRDSFSDNSSVDSAGGWPLKM